MTWDIYEKLPAAVQKLCRELFLDSIKKGDSPFALMTAIILFNRVFQIET
jgi:hypothetical protein